MVSSKVKYSTIGVALVLFSGLLSVMFASDPLFAQGSNQTAGNRTGEGLQAVANETGELLGNASKGVQEFFNQGGQNQSG